MRLTTSILIICCTLTLCSSPAVFAASIEDQVKKSLETMDIKSVHHTGNRLKIVTNEKRLTTLIYKSVISTICMGQLWQPQSLTGISEIKVLNFFDHDGFIFEGGDAECKELNKTPGNDLEIFILSKTHTI